MTYRYVQGISYGSRKGTRGISFHMSEGYDGLPSYLGRHGDETRAEWADRVNGVSCHVAILSTGEIVQMLRWGDACGNLNPDHRAGEYGYYGHHHLVDVLGDGWTDPNAWTLSAELAGFRAQGPTQAQVRSAIKWGREMRVMFPTIRGAVGHHDQSTKPCPGTTPAMKAIFVGVGGHGLFAAPLEDDLAALAITPIDVTRAYIVRVAATTTTYGPNDGERGSIGPRDDGRPAVRNALGVYGIDGLGGKRAFLLPDRTLILEDDVTFELNGRDIDTTAEPITYELLINGATVEKGVTS